MMRECHGDPAEGVFQSQPAYCVTRLLCYPLMAPPGITSNLSGTREIQFAPTLFCTNT